MSTFLSLAPLLKTYPKMYMISAAQGCYVHKNRNEIVERARLAKAKHLLFIDTDMSFTLDDVIKLFTLDKDIVAGGYNLRKFPQTSAVKLMDKDGKITKDFIPTDKPFKCYAAPTGFMLIKMSVFDKLEKPYFFFSYETGEMEGEDIYFCRKVREKGFDVWVDPSIQVKHIGEYAY